MTAENENVPMNPATDLHAQNLDISFNDDINISTLDKFPSLQKGEVARFSIVSFNANNDPRVKMSQYFFDNENKFGFLAPVNKEMLAKCIAKLGEPKLKFGTIVVKYTTDRLGNVLGNPPGITYYAWLFAQDKFKPMKALHKEWNLFGRDLIVTCEDAQYQKFVIAPAQDCVWMHLPNKDEILQTGTLLYENQIGKFFNREIPDAELNIKLGFVSAPALATAASPFAAKALPPAANQANAFSTLVKPK
jgi:hypothetical protein